MGETDSISLGADCTLLPSSAALTLIFEVCLEDLAGSILLGKEFEEVLTQALVKEHQGNGAT